LIRLQEFPIPVLGRFSLLLCATLGLLSCGPQAPCSRCDTLVIAAVNEPSSLIPPLVFETVGRDISDQLFERLADLTPGRSPADTGAYRPRLAARWERVDSLTWDFHLRPGAAWSDGRPVLAADVVFSFEAYADSVLDASARSVLAGHVVVTALDPTTAEIHFDRNYPEQLYDATWHVRILPAHIWRSIPYKAWATDTVQDHLIGSGPYRLGAWVRGQSIELVASRAGAAPRAGIAHVIWRFAADPEVALNLVMAHEADLLETLTTPERAAKVETDSALRIVPYPSAVYGFVGYNVARSPLGDPRVRRALNQAVDRAAIATRLFGAGAKAPPGPMSQLLWLWDDSVRVLPVDSAAAAAALDKAGWRIGPHGVRRSGRRRLAFDLLVPSTSAVRRRAAEILQERWRGIGAAVTVTAVDFSLFQERLARGRFDSYVATYLDEPSPRGLADQWTTAGIGVLNYGHYSNPAFDRRFGGAVAEPDPARARAKWRQALDTLNADAPGLFLFAPVNQAAVTRRLGSVTLNPYSWLSELSTWHLSERGR
jgi:peptide/nickel transport system substrate-binding protein